jgi:hypothetical protein
MPPRVTSSSASPPAPPSATAYLDESYDIRPGRGYVLGAVVTSSNDAQLRDLVRGLRLKGQDRLHFGQEAVERRLLVAEIVAGLGVAMVAAVAHVGPRRATAARLRGRCLRALYPELAGVQAVVIESRGLRPDRHDASVLAGLARPGPPCALSFLRAADDPVLWVADFVAGAVFQDVVRGVPAYRAALGEVHVVTVP